MKAVTNVAKLGLVLGLAAVLTACGGAPSDAEVRKAVEAKILQERKQVSGMTGLLGSDFEDMAESMMPKINDISPQGCEAADKDIYNCTVESTMTVMGIEQTIMQDFSFKKNKNGEWKILR